MSDLSQVLWREREALEVLWFKLEEERLLLEARSWRWLGHASRELEAVLDQLGELELSRAVALAAAAAALDLPADIGLRHLAAAASPPWSSMLDRHLQAMRSLAGDVLTLAEGNRPVLREALAEVRRALDERTEPSIRLLLEAAGLEAAISSNRRVLQPSLVEVVLG